MIYMKSAAASETTPAFKSFNGLVSLHNTECSLSIYIVQMGMIPESHLQLHSPRQDTEEHHNDDKQS